MGFVATNSDPCIFVNGTDMMILYVDDCAIISKTEGEAKDEYFKDKEVGSVDSLKGKLENVPYNIFCMKYPDYVMKIMSTYGGLLENDWQKELVRKYKDGNREETKTFKYKIPFSNNFDCRYCVDDHNRIRHQIPSLEQTWKTQRWASREFSFLVAVSEVNCYLAFRYIVWEDNNTMEFMSFYSKLAWALIDNNFKKICDKPSVRGRKRKPALVYELATVPPFARIWTGAK